MRPNYDITCFLINLQGHGLTLILVRTAAFSHGQWKETALLQPAVCTDVRHAMLSPCCLSAGQWRRIGLSAGSLKYSWWRPWLFSALRDWGALPAFEMVSTGGFRRHMKKMNQAVRGQLCWWAHYVHRSQSQGFGSIHACLNFRNNHTMQRQCEVSRFLRRDALKS